MKVSNVSAYIKEAYDYLQRLNNEPSPNSIQDSTGANKFASAMTVDMYIEDVSIGELFTFFQLFGDAVTVVKTYDLLEQNEDLSDYNKTVVDILNRLRNMESQILADEDMPEYATDYMRVPYMDRRNISLHLSGENLLKICNVTSVYQFFHAWLGNRYIDRYEQETNMTYYRIPPYEELGKEISKYYAEPFDQFIVNALLKYFYNTYSRSTTGNGDIITESFYHNTRYSKLRYGDSNLESITTAYGSYTLPELVSLSSEDVEALKKNLENNPNVYVSLRFCLSYGFFLYLYTTTKYRHLITSWESLMVISGKENAYVDKPKCLGNYQVRLGNTTKKVTDFLNQKDTSHIFGVELMSYGYPVSFNISGSLDDCMALATEVLDLYTSLPLVQKDVHTFSSQLEMLGNAVARHILV